MSTNKTIQNRKKRPQLTPSKIEELRKCFDPISPDIDEYQAIRNGKIAAKRNREMRMPKMTPSPSTSKKEELKKCFDPISPDVDLVAKIKERQIAKRQKQK